jgi:hypothetical protein
VGICKTCGKNSDSDYCFQHKPRKPLLDNSKGLIRKVSVKGNYKAMESLKEEIDKVKLQMRNMFLNIWKKRKHNSEVSGDYLGNEPMSTYFHHILAKSKYPEACLDEENIILLSLLEHSNVENDMYRYDEINKRRNILNEKYNII